MTTCPEVLEMAKNLISFLAHTPTMDLSDEKIGDLLPNLTNLLQLGVAPLMSDSKRIDFLERVYSTPRHEWTSRKLVFKYGVLETLREAIDNEMQTFKEELLAVGGVECEGDKRRVDDVLQPKEESSAKPETLSPQTNVVSERPGLSFEGFNFLSDEMSVAKAMNQDADRAKFSISFIQRRLRFGYQHAIDIANRMAAKGAIEFRSNSEIYPLWNCSVAGSGTKRVAASTDDGGKEKEVVPHDCQQEKENKRLLAEAMWHPGVRDVEEVFSVVHPDTERHQLERADWIRERNQLRTILEALPADNIIGTPNTEPASLEWFAEKFGYRCGFPALVEMLRNYAALRRQYTKPLIELYSKLGRITPPRSAAMSDTDKKE